MTYLRWPWPLTCSGGSHTLSWSPFNTSCSSFWNSSTTSSSSPTSFTACQKTTEASAHKHKKHKSNRPLGQHLHPNESMRARAHHLRSPWPTPRSLLMCPETKMLLRSLKHRRQRGNIRQTHQLSHLPNLPMVISFMYTSSDFIHLFIDVSHNKELELFKWCVRMLCLCAKNSFDQVKMVAETLEPTTDRRRGRNELVRRVTAHFCSHQVDLCTAAGVRTDLRMLVEVKFSWVHDLPVSRQQGMNVYTSWSLFTVQ